MQELVVMGVSRQIHAKLYSVVIPIDVLQIGC